MSLYLLIHDALTFMGKKHGNQMRKDGKIPYIIHPLRVFILLRWAGYSEFIDKNLMVVALLHDILEDTDTTSEEIEEKFGPDILSLVMELTRPKKIEKEQWLKSFKTCSREAKIIKLADRIDNLNDLKSNHWSKEWKYSYVKQGEIILKTCCDADKKLALELKRLIQAILKENNDISSV
ncbi:MAG: HD domain-containing protein [Promethearchaeota archaeon]